MGKRKSYGYVLVVVLLLGSCIKPYEPEVIKAANNFLVVDGIINCAPNGETGIKLTRTRKLTDTVTSIPELGALVTIEGAGGDHYSLQEKQAGLYASAPLTLNTTSNYRLKIFTADGDSYASDFTPVTLTPPIDSLSWKQEENRITIYVNTHDPQNKTRYYRWEYDETWQYRTPIEATINYKNGQIVYRTDDELTNVCWQSAVSTDILQQSTAQLRDDIVQLAPLVVHSAQSPRFMTKYSINVKQFALTKEAYEYWQILKRNTQQLGSIFDAQPSQLIGNLHNLTKKNEPAIGYITAATIQEKRIFIRNAEVVNPASTQSNCISKVIPVDSAAYYLANQLYVPAHFVGTGGGAIAITTSNCIDCRLSGGTTQRPPFWQ